MPFVASFHRNRAEGNGSGSHRSLFYFSEPLGIAPSWLCRTGSPYPPQPLESVPEPRLRIMPGLFIWGRGFAPGASKPQNFKRRREINRS